MQVIAAKTIRFIANCKLQRWDKRQIIASMAQKKGHYEKDLAETNKAMCWLM